MRRRVSRILWPLIRILRKILEPSASKGRGERQIELLMQACKEKLAHNGHKGGWDQETVAWLFRRLREETDELERACVMRARFGARRGEVLKEGADVTNFAMMICDVMGEFDRGASSPPKG